MTESKNISIPISPEVLKGVYSNMAQVQHTSEEFVLDFFSLLPPSGSLNARIIMSPSHYKRLLRAMEENIKKYEEQFGTISLAITSDQKIEFK